MFLFVSVVSIVSAVIYQSLNVYFCNPNFRKEFIKINVNNERHLYNWTFNPVQYLYDSGLVWSFEIQGDEVVGDIGAFGHHSDQLGHCILRILFSGPRQPYRIPGKRWTLLVDGIKSDTGGYYTYCFCAFFACRF